MDDDDELVFGLKEEDDVLAELTEFSGVRKTVEDDDVVAGY